MARLGYVPSLGPSHGDQSILLCHWPDLLTWLCGHSEKAVIGPFGSCVHHGGWTVLFSRCWSLFTWLFRPGGGSAHLDARRRWFLRGQGRGGSAPPLVGPRPPPLHVPSPGPAGWLCPPLGDGELPLLEPPPDKGCGRTPGTVQPVSKAVLRHCPDSAAFGETVGSGTRQPRLGYRPGPPVLGKPTRWPVSLKLGTGTGTGPSCVWFPELLRRLVRAESRRLSSERCLLKSLGDSFQIQDYEGKRTPPAPVYPPVALGPSGQAEADLWEGCLKCVLTRHGWACLQPGWSAGRTGFVSPSWSPFASR